VPSKAIESPFTSRKARSTYDSLSRTYEYLTAYEGGAKRRGLELAAITPCQRVLEVGFGTGTTLCAIAGKAGEGGSVVGIDISAGMLRRAAQSISRACLQWIVSLSLAEASHLPFRCESFDTVFSSYVLDLMAEKEIALALGEFFRVAKPGGRMVLVSLSKGDSWRSNMKAYEWLYRLSPSLLGGCRPLLLEGLVLGAGFTNVAREFLMAGGLMPSEIISCNKPS
jgi:ubiquinone/menaquinone biosynthesis C-methylase UbiE